MSESATEQATTTDAPTDQTQGNPDEAALGDAGKKALDAMKAERNEAKRQQGLLQAQLDQINRANESAIEKSQRELREAQEAALTAGTEALRYRIAAEKGITDNVDLILTAPDEDTMRRQADLWSARTASSTTTPAGPRPDLSQGGHGGSSASSDPASALAEFLKQRRT